jgi:hypothetical protein
MRRLRLKPPSPAGVPILVSLQAFALSPSLARSLARSLSLALLKLLYVYFLCRYAGSIRINVYSVRGSGGGSIKALLRLH